MPDMDFSHNGQVHILLYTLMNSSVLSKSEVDFINSLFDKKRADIKAGDD